MSGLFLWLQWLTVPPNFCDSSNRLKQLDFCFETTLPNMDFELIRNKGSSWLQKIGSHQRPKIDKERNSGEGLLEASSDQYTLLKFPSSVPSCPLSHVFLSFIIMIEYFPLPKTSPARVPFAYISHFLTICNHHLEGRNPPKGFLGMKNSTLTLGLVNPG